MRRAPSMAGLRAFEAVLRLGSVAAAARELCVTPTAISHRLRDLEQEVGTPLLRRTGQRLEATERGQLVQAALGDAFVRLRQAFEIAQGGQAVRPLRVVAASSFAVGWLLDRLAAFRAACPGSDLHLEPAEDPLAPREYAPDILLHHGSAPPEPRGWDRLFNCEAFAVSASPRPVTLEAVASAPLIHCDVREGLARGGPSWQAWFAAKRLAPAPDAPRPQHVTQAYAALRLALRGEGVALLSRHLIEAPVRDGSLSVVPGSGFSPGTALWVKVVEGAPRQDAQRFVDWLRQATAGLREASGSLA